MGRFRGAWVVVALGLAAAGLSWLRPEIPEPFPLADLVPDDALVYAGFPAPEGFEAFLERLDPDRAADWRRRSVPLRPHLRGAVAWYLDAERRGVLLVRLRRLATLSPELEVDGDALVVAEGPAALARHRARKRPLLGRPGFAEQGRRGFVNLEALVPPGRLGDFAAAHVELDPGPPLAIRGVLRYRPGTYRTYLEHYVHAPRQGAPPPSGAAFTEPPVRLWGEILAALEPRDRELVEREELRLSRDVLGGRGAAEFLRRLGPAWGASLEPGPAGLPALSLWVELPPEEVPVAREVIRRAAADGAKLRKDRGLPPMLDLEERGELTRLRFGSEAERRWGDSLAPSFGFRENRLILASIAELPDPPPLSGGDHHLSLRIDAGALAALLTSGAALLKDLGLPEAPPVLSRLGRVELDGRYTGEGLRFELRCR